jgi:hypothetical protein
MDSSKVCLDAFLATGQALLQQQVPIATLLQSSTTEEQHQATLRQLEQLGRAIQFLTGAAGSRGGQPSEVRGRQIACIYFAL